MFEKFCPLHTGEGRPGRGIALGFHGLRQFGYDRGLDPCPGFDQSVAPPIGRGDDEPSGRKATVGLTWILLTSDRTGALFQRFRPRPNAGSIEG